MNLRVVKRRGDNDNNVDPGAPDDGFSLVEVVITIVLIGIVVIPLMIASATSVTASSRTRESAETETVLQNAADRLNRAPAKCDYDLYVQAALKAKGWDPATVMTGYEYYKPGDTVLIPGTWQIGACPGAPAPAAGTHVAGLGGPGGDRSPMLLQRVTISVASPTGNVNQMIRVIKNDV